MAIVTSIFGARSHKLWEEGDEAFHFCGYRFIALDEALKDSAYASEDRFTGPGGITWLHRWAITAGKSGDFFAGEPEVPAFVREAARLR